MNNQKFYVVWDSSASAFDGALGVYDSYELALKEMQSYVDKGGVEYLHCYLVNLNSPINTWRQVIGYSEEDGEEWSESSQE